jgi:hypothetical protein
VDRDSSSESDALAVLEAVERFGADVLAWSIKERLLILANLLVRTASDKQSSSSISSASLNVCLCGMRTSIAACDLGSVSAAPVAGVGMMLVCRVE